MPAERPSGCRCPACIQGTDHPDKQHHRELRLFLASLSQEQRRLYAAVEANRLGRGGVRIMSQITGLCTETIRSGRRQLVDLLEGRSLKRREPCGGRRLIESKYPGITAALEEMLVDEVAGDPMSEQKWMRSTVKRLRKLLQERGFEIGHSTVWRLLKRMGFAMRMNLRRRRGPCKDPARRDEQFAYIASQRKVFQEARLPVISVDTKKKELIGNFRNNGRAWCRRPPEVDEHDFPSAAECRAVPYGVYDLARNRGYVVVGTSHDTPEFAVNTISRWWREESRVAYQAADRLLILADGGGANGCRSRGWLLSLQRLCDDQKLTVTVCHYPTGCSKWNPVERRLFSYISINWAGKPLRTLGVMLGYIRGTTTSTGLAVKAHLDEETYRKGQKISREELDRLRLKRHEVCPDWNYTISPRR
jgi:hypothetical protein